MPNERKDNGEVLSKITSGLCVDYVFTSPVCKNQSGLRGTI